MLIFAAVFAVIGVLLLLKSFAATIYYISPSGNDNNPCSQTQPCQSFNRAYQLASPGDTVQMAGGTYGDQTITYRSNMRNTSCDPLGQWGAANSSSCITFRPASGANVTTGGMNISGSGVYLNGTRNGSVAGPSDTYNFKVFGELVVITDIASQPIDHVTAYGIDANGIGIYDADHILYKNVDSGGTVVTSGCGTYDPDTGQPLGDVDESKIGSRQGIVPSNVVLDGIYFHDVMRDNAGANNGGAVGPCHRGALFFINGNGVTIRNSVWSQNWVYDMQVQNFNGQQYPTNVTIENNWFGCGVEGGNITTNPGGENQCNGQAAIQFDAAPTNWLIRYNSTGPGTSLFGCYVGSCTPFTNVRVVGNVGSRTSSCPPVTYGYNAFTEGPCGTGDVTWNGSFVSTTVGAENFHLSNGTSNANNLATLTTSDYSLGTDIDGESRSAPRDAGADEFGGVVTPPPPPPPTVSLTANPTNITSGQTSTLSWSSSGATVCSASSPSGWTNSTATSGSQVVSPTTTTTYSINCSGANGTNSASATVTVGSTSGPPTITSISPTSGPVGSQVTINGTNLDQTTIVEFNQGGTVSYTINSSTKITATVPTGAQTGQISINQGQAVSPTFTVTGGTAKTGDLNGDGRVDVTDLSILLANWNTTNANSDINKDGTVNIFDLSILLSKFGS